MRGNSVVDENDWNYIVFFLPVAKLPLVGQDLLIIEASRSRSHRPLTVGFLWTSDRPVAEIST